MYNQIASNKRRSWFLMIILTILIVVVGYAGMLIYGFDYSVLIGAGIFAVIVNIIGYYQGGSIALAVNGAKKIEKNDNPYVYNMVENLAITAGLPMPAVYIMQDQSLNAFATGRDPQHSAVAVTTGIVQALQNEELEGVLAHEMSHIKNYDIRIATLAVALLGVIMILIDFFWRMGFLGIGRDNDRGKNPVFMIIGLILLILAPIIGKLIQLAVSRQREYMADASGSLLTRYPTGLANALEKISHESRPMAHANNATAHLFFASPFGRGKVSFLSKFFSTHPPIEERIARLRQMGGGR
ncbi:MAG: zinc metalloprotease HtpX [bacterium]|nr:zinc metalloprotease HtpX [bacterium]